jgi:hypothetical protein
MTRSYAGKNFHEQIDDHIGAFRGVSFEAAIPDAQNARPRFQRAQEIQTVSIRSCDLHRKWNRLERGPFRDCGSSELVQPDESNAGGFLEFVEIPEIHLHALLIDEIMFDLRYRGLQSGEIGIDARPVGQCANQDFALSFHNVVFVRCRLTALPQKNICRRQENGQRKAADHESVEANEAEELSEGVYGVG